jgi:hypothetical protein
MKRIIIPILGLCLLPSLAAAAGIEVAPATLEFRVTAGKTQTREVVVTNPTTDVQMFEISADEFGDQIKINPSSFILEAGNRKNIRVEVRVAGLSSGSVRTTTLSVVSRPLKNPGITVNAGIKIPITINAQQTSIPWVTIVLAAMTVILLAVYWLRRKKLKTA